MSLYHKRVIIAKYGEVYIYSIEVSTHIYHFNIIREIYDKFESLRNSP